LGEGHHTFKDIFFTPENFINMPKKPNAKIEKKDHDFAIGVKINTTLQCFGSMRPESDTWDLPAVAVECKTYLELNYFSKKGDDHGAI
jgi:hypothetical protein